MMKSEKLMKRIERWNAIKELQKEGKYYYNETNYTQQIKSKVDDKKATPGAPMKPRIVRKYNKSDSQPVVRELFT